MFIVFTNHQSGLSVGMGTLAIPAAIHVEGNLSLRSHYLSNHMSHALRVVIDMIKGRYNSIRKSVVQYLVDYDYSMCTGYRSAWIKTC